MNDLLLAPLPTGKPNISFSEIADWKACSWRHKLKHIDKVRIESYSPHAAFGSAVHKACEHYLKNRVMDDTVALAQLRKSWLTESASYAENMRDIKPWEDTVVAIVKEIPEFLEAQFPGWKFVAAEKQIYEPIAETGVIFKGFIDGIISVPGPRGKELTWILDAKTCGWGWAREKKSDFTTQLQLRLYKQFWSQASGTPMKDLRTAFLLLKRTAKEGKRCELVPVSVGDKTAEQSMQVARNMISSLRRGFCVKNKQSCKWCEYKETKWCP